MENYVKSARAHRCLSARTARWPPFDNNAVRKIRPAIALESTQVGAQELKAEYIEGRITAAAFHLLEHAILDADGHQNKKNDGQIAQCVPPVIGDCVVDKRVRDLVNVMGHTNENKRSDDHVQDRVTRHEY